MDAVGELLTSQNIKHNKVHALQAILNTETI